jgi:hypothetical protein
MRPISRPLGAGWWREVKRLYALAGRGSITKELCNGGISFRKSDARYRDQGRDEGQPQCAHEALGLGGAEELRMGSRVRRRTEFAQEAHRIGTVARAWLPRERAFTVPHRLTRYPLTRPHFHSSGWVAGPCALRGGLAGACARDSSSNGRSCRSGYPGWRCASRRPTSLRSRSSYSRSRSGR